MNENIGIVIYADAQPMDIIGPWEVLSFWKNILHAPVNMYLIAENSGYVECVNDIVLKAHKDFNTAPQLDYLIIPGGPGRLTQINNQQLISFIKHQATHCKYILSDCTGMFLLYKAGLLTNKNVTTYWRALPELKSFPDVNVIEERIVKNNNIWTAGGVSSGIDLALELIAEIAGKETAGQVQLLFEYFPKNTLYCSTKTIETLPPYRANKEDIKAHLPTYIEEYLKSHTDNK